MHRVIRACSFKTAHRLVRELSIFIFMVLIFQVSYIIASDGLILIVLLFVPQSGLRTGESTLRNALVETRDK